MPSLATTGASQEGEELPFKQHVLWQSMPHEYDYVRLFGGTPEENFLSNLNTKDAFDYVSYEDIVPYDPDHGNESVSSMIFKAPIVHDLFDTFLVVQHNN